MAEKTVSEDRALQARKPMPAKYFDEDQHVRPASVLISKPIDEVWAFIRNQANMPKFVRGLKSVDVKTPMLSHWVFEHDGHRHENESEIIAEEMNFLLVWRAVGTKNQVGAVTLENAPGGRGTFVSMRTSSDHEPGKIVGALKGLFGGDAKSTSYINLRRLKAFMETGEVPTVEGQPTGNETTQTKH